MRVCRYGELTDPSVCALGVGAGQQEKSLEHGCLVVVIEVIIVHNTKRHEKHVIAIARCVASGGRVISLLAPDGRGPLAAEPLMEVFGVPEDICTVIASFQYVAWHIRLGALVFSHLENTERARDDERA